MLSNFLGYSVFSTLEYMGIFYMTFTLFSLYPKYHIKKLVISSLVISIFSYLCIVLNIYNYVPVPILTVLTMFFITHSIVGKKISYSFSVAGGGFLTAALVQLTVTGLFLNNGFLNIERLSDSFSLKTYTVQSLNILIFFSMALISHFLNVRFGYSFRKGKKYKKFVALTFSMLFIFVVVFTIFSFINANENTYLLMFIVIVISVIIFLYLSHKQDEHEFK